MKSIAKFPINFFCTSFKNQKSRNYSTLISSGYHFKTINETANNNFVFSYGYKVNFNILNGLSFCFYRNILYKKNLKSIQFYKRDVNLNKNFYSSLISKSIKIFSIFHWILKQENLNFKFSWEKLSALFLISQSNWKLAFGLKQFSDNFFIISILNQTLYAKTGYQKQLNSFASSIELNTLVNKPSWQTGRLFDTTFDWPENNTFREDELQYEESWAVSELDLLLCEYPTWLQGSTRGISHREKDPLNKYFNTVDRKRYSSFPWSLWDLINYPQSKWWKYGRCWLIEGGQRLIYRLNNKTYNRIRGAHLLRIKNSNSSIITKKEQNVRVILETLNILPKLSFGILKKIKSSAIQRAVFVHLTIGYTELRNLSIKIKRQSMDRSTNSWVHKTFKWAIRNKKQNNTIVVRQSSSFCFWRRLSELRLRGDSFKGHVNYVLVPIQKTKDVSFFNWLANYWLIPDSIEIPLFFVSLFQLKRFQPKWFDKKLYVSLSPFCLWYTQKR